MYTRESLAKTTVAGLQVYDGMGFESYTTKKNTANKLLLYSPETTQYQMPQGAFGVVILDGVHAVKRYVHSVGGRLSTDAVREICALRYLPPHDSIVGLLCFRMSPHVESRHPRAMSDLFSMIRSNSHMSGRMRRRMRHQLASGIAHLHAHGIMHRDIKSPNILVYAHTRVCLGDFGTSVPIVPGRANTLCVGTPMYAAPEMTRSDYDQRVDWFSFGIVCAEMHAGQTPLCDATSYIRHRVTTTSAEVRYISSLVDPDPNTRTMHGTPATWAAAECIAASLPVWRGRINNKMRDILFEWLDDINNAWAQGEIALQHSKRIVDAYIVRFPGTTSERLQLIGASCLSLSWKLVGTSKEVSAAQLSYLSAKAFSVDEVYWMERFVLQTFSGYLLHLQLSDCVKKSRRDKCVVLGHEKKKGTM